MSNASNAYLVKFKRKRGRQNVTSVLLASIKMLVDRTNAKSVVLVNTVTTKVWSVV